MREARVMSGNAAGRTASEPRSSLEGLRPAERARALLLPALAPFRPAVWPLVALLERAGVRQVVNFPTTVQTFGEGTAAGLASVGYCAEAELRLPLRSAERG